MRSAGLIDFFDPGDGDRLKMKKAAAGVTRGGLDG